MAGDLLKTIHADLNEHGNILKGLEEESELRKATMTTQGKLYGPNVTGIERKHRRAGDSRSFRKSCSKFLKSTFANGKLAINPEIPESSTPHDVDDDTDDGHDGDNDSIDNDKPRDQATTMAGAEETLATNSPHTPEYDIIIENNEWIQVPVDSKEYHLAISHSTDHDVYDGHPREMDAIDSMSDDEWDDIQYSPIEESTEFLTSANCLAYPADAETQIEKSTFEMCFQRQTHIFISDTVISSLRNDTMSTKLDFCIDLTTIADDTQVFSVIEPCSTRNRLQCKHITLRIGHVPDTPISSPCMIQLTRLDCEDFSTDALHDVSSRQSCTLMSSPICQHPSRCHHTKVEDQKHNEPRCSMPSKLYGWLADTQRTTECFDIDTETAPSDDATTDAPETDSGMTPSPDDDGYAFDLLNHVMADEASQLPSEIEWDVFVRFLPLADKYGRNYGDRPFEQAKCWVSMFRPSESLDREAITWLWIMWKLQMGPEFKKLSSIIQRQAEVPISSLKIQCENQHYIELPKFVLGM